MFIICASCGATIQDDVQLCPYCGKPPVQTTKPTTDKASWDYCGILARRIPIKYKWSGNVEYECYFWAEAVGKNGPYTAATTDKYYLEQKGALEPDPMGVKESDRCEAKAKLNGLIKKLQDDGWEMLPERGPEVWSYKFKRLTNLRKVNAT